MKVIKIGIAPQEKIRERVLAIAKGEIKPKASALLSILSPETPCMGRISVLPSFRARVRAAHKEFPVPV